MSLETPTAEVLTTAQIRRGVVTLADCPGWTEFVLPSLRRHLKQLRDKVLNGDGSPDDIFRARDERLALVNFFKRLDATRAWAFEAMTAEESMQVPVTVIPKLERLFRVEDEPPAVAAAAPKQPKIQFPPAHTFNPFAAAADKPTTAPAPAPKAKKKRDAKPAPPEPSTP